MKVNSDKYHDRRIYNLRIPLQHVINKVVLKMSIYNLNIMSFEDNDIDD